MSFYRAEDVRADARNRWTEILEHFGADRHLLRNIHGPCPACSGKDRFRFDDQDGNGSFICSQGGADLLAGDGLALLGHLKKWDWKKCVAEVGDFLQSAKNFQPSGTAATVVKDVTPPPEKPTFKQQSLKEFASRWRDSATTAWLADRSSVNPFRISANAFLSHLYKAGECVVTFTVEKSQGQAVWPYQDLPLTGPNGVWFLAQPVDGKVHPNPRNDNKPSRRAEEAVTSWRYLVLESDQADLKDWISALVQLPLAIAAIYTSGKRSIHALIRVDAPSIGEWRNFANAIKPVLVMLGADQQVASSAVRLSRLPSCMREGSTDKHGNYKRFANGPQLQKLLYLNPSPTAQKICTLPKIRDVIDHWTEAAFKHLPRDAGEIIIRHFAAKGYFPQVDADGRKTFSGIPRVFDLMIEALERHADPGLFSATVDECLFALEWFSTSPGAAEMLKKLRARA